MGLSLDSRLDGPGSIPALVGRTFGLFYARSRLTSGMFRGAGKDIATSLSDGTKNRGPSCANRSAR